MTRIYEVIQHSDENEQKKAEILNILHRIFQSSVHGPKMTHPTEMISENGRIGALFASKAFVQLLVNPLVGKATNQYGYEWPFIFGTGVLLISSFSKLVCFIVHIGKFEFKKCIFFIPAIIASTDLSDLFSDLT